ncbi:MAG: hypothetical protein ACQCN3_00795 [Candidatus Bathyarchaeia archaeon]|jgi:hypothetical protein
MSTKTQESKNQFESPLEQYIREKCKNCRCWHKNHGQDAPFYCTSQTPEGVDLMFLCMSANNLKVETDPKKIFTDAYNVLADLQQKNFIKLPELPIEEQTPDEHPAPAGLSPTFQQRRITK